jgi:hypothetical protein
VIELVELPVSNAPRVPRLQAELSAQNNLLVDTAHPTQIFIVDLINGFIGQISIPHPRCQRSLFKVAMILSMAIARFAP